MPEINLPSKPRKAVQKTPRRIILFSKPKIGKTSTVAKLKDCLILDFERGTHAVDALAMDVKSIAHLHQILNAIKEGDYPYKYIAIDTVSALEEMCLKEAERRYAQSTDGAKWLMADPNDKTKLHPKSGKAQHGTILNLGFGKGYVLLNEVFTEAIQAIERHAPNIILMAHSTYSSVTKDDKEISTIDIMLQKKTKFSATFKADAIGYMYRKGSKNYINFTASEDSGAGGRHRYLEKEPILISEFVDKNGEEELVTYWDSIYAPKNSKSTKSETPKEK